MFFGLFSLHIHHVQFTHVLIMAVGLVHHSCFFCFSFYISQDFLWALRQKNIGFDDNWKQSILFYFDCFVFYKKPPECKTQKESRRTTSMAWLRAKIVQDKRQVARHHLASRLGNIQDFQVKMLLQGNVSTPTRLWQLKLNCILQQRETSVISVSFYKYIIMCSWSPNQADLNFTNTK